MNTAQGFGGYDILADAAAIAAWAWQRRRRPWYVRPLDAALEGLAVACVYLVSGAALLLCVALGLGAAWVVLAVVRVVGW